MKTSNTKIQPKKTAQPEAPKVLQLANPRLARVPAPPSSAPRVAQAKAVQKKAGPKISAPPVYRPVAKKVVQPMMAVRAQQKKLRGPLIGTASTIQRAEENPYKKEYPSSYGPREPSKRASARDSPYGRKEAHSSRLRARAGGGGGRPNYVPPKDSLGHKIWNGERKSLGWTDTVTAAMAPTKGGGCQVHGDLCTGLANGIDHITDFADLQSGITQYLICDGRHHFRACYRDDAMAVYNNNDDTSNMQWSCTKCNSQMGGKKGLYQNVPKWIERCPGEDCTYQHKGEEM